MSDPAAGPPAPASDAELLCPTCGAEVAAGESFCEACGTSLALIAPEGGDEAAAWPVGPYGAEGEESPISLSRPVAEPASPGTGEDTVVTRRPCASCGGPVGADGYCEICGAKAPSERDHYTEQPASWVAACSDRGIRHHRNEDASAVAADPEPGSRAVLVVCDGVSTSSDSDVASLAAARAARDVLVAHRPEGLGLPASRIAALASGMEWAVKAANDAVIAATDPASPNAASCTFAAAVLEGSLVIYGNVGDSRVYWLPDPASEAVSSPDPPRLLSLDDSVAQLRIDSGSSREEAETGPQAHAITKWLGRDSPDFSPTTGSIELAAPGWLVVSSDGLWNYASDPYALQRLVAEQSAAVAGVPLALAEALIRWACEQGGKDNITVALARHR